MAFLHCDHRPLYLNRNLANMVRRRHFVGHFLIKSFFLGETADLGWNESRAPSCQPCYSQHECLTELYGSSIFSFSKIGTLRVSNRRPLRSQTRSLASVSAPSRKPRPRSVRKKIFDRSFCRAQTMHPRQHRTSMLNFLIRVHILGSPG